MHDISFTTVFAALGKSHRTIINEKQVKIKTK